MSMTIRIIALAVAFLLTIIPSFAQQSSFTLFLAGDGGDAYSIADTPALQMLADSLGACEGTCGVLFLGDNLYESGLAPLDHPDRVRGEQILNAQIEAARLATGPVVFVPGNHDSGHRGVGGDLRRLQEMERYIESHLGEGAFLPHDGLPGPVVLHPHPFVALIVINSQWWFEGDHRGERTGQYVEPSRFEVLNRISEAIRDNQERHVILATHHPVRSAGDHALYWDSRITLKGLVKRVVGAPQDYSERAYQRYRHDILQLAQRYPDVIIVSGHEHNLTYFDSPGHHIVSGSLSRPEWASRRNDPTFASGAAGYGTLHVTGSGALSLSFFGVQEDGRRDLLFRQEIACLAQVPAWPGLTEVPLRTDFATPSPSFETHLAPTYSLWQGAGGAARIRYTIAENRIRPRAVFHLSSEYHHLSERVASHAGVHIEHAASATGVRGSVDHAGRIDKLMEREESAAVRHTYFEIEPYGALYAYDRLFSIMIGGALRHHQTRTDSWVGLPFISYHENESSLAVRLGIRVNTVDSQVVPEGGIDAHVQVRGIVYDSAADRLDVKGHLRYFRSFGFRRPLTLALGNRLQFISGRPPLIDFPAMNTVRGYAPLSRLGQGTITSSIEVRQTLLHLDNRRNRAGGLLAFFDTGVLFPFSESDLITTRPGWDATVAADPVTFVSGGGGAWLNVSRRVVMTATLITSKEGPVFLLGPSFHF